jgi:heme/copper-type cytochrome/quinol oxidase subunit 2
MPDLDRWRFIIATDLERHLGDHNALEVIMGCFSLGWLEEILIFVVVFCLIFAIIKLLVPRIMGAVGMPPGGNTVLTILWWIVGAVILIAIIIFLFNLAQCFLGGGGYHSLR